jgi:alkylated DNA repair dioxygenase AlkB
MVPELIKTSYSFASAYESGTALPAHTDRPQCVFNVSLLLGSAPEDATLSDWPLYIRRDNQDHRVDLEAGDGVLYSGTQDLHWREKLPEHLTSVLGVFFHYVPQGFTGSLA